ncbi:MAG TPA: radical SAM protein [Polyangia bacterium]
MPRIAIITPPVVKPSEPNLSGAAAARALRARGVWARAIDASIGWYARVLSRPSLERAGAAAAAAGATPGALLALRRAIRSVTADPPPLRAAATYASRFRYSSAVAHLETALAGASAPFPGVRLRVAYVDVDGHRPESSASLASLAPRPSPFDEYYCDELIPALAALGVTHAGISLTFQNQAFGAVRLAALLRARLPGVVRLLGGPLLTCWHAAGAPLAGPAFALFDRLLPAGTEAELGGLAVELGGTAERAGPPGPLTVDLDETPWDAYLAPQPTVPAALGRGCSWRRCTFCPDHLHGAHEPCGERSVDDFLRAVAARFPAGAMLHLTDSALPPRHLEHLAEVIRRERLPLRWHGFVRVEPDFADPDYARHLAAGGCAMLQLGIESGSPRLLELMGKGAGPDRSRAALRALHAAGIRNQVYLLFGLPTETDADRELTLAFVEAEAAAIHDLNHALLNLPRLSPMHRRPQRFGISAVVPFHADTDLSLYDDFRCGDSHPRVEARRWLDRRFLKSAAVKRILGGWRAPFKANHACFVEAGAEPEGRAGREPGRSRGGDPDGSAGGAGRHAPWDRLNRSR